MNKTLRTILIVLGTLVGLAAAVALGFFVVRGIAGGYFGHSVVMERYHTFQSPDGRFLGSRPMMAYNRFDLFGGILARLLGFGVLAAFGALVMWAVLRLFGSRGSYQAQTSAPASFSVQEILDRRYARGEISREEYLQILQDTGHTAPDMPNMPAEPNEPAEPDEPTAE